MTELGLYLFIILALLYCSIVHYKIELRSMINGTLSKSERIDNLRFNISQLIFPSVLCLIIGILMTSGTVYVVKKFYTVPKLGHIFIADNFKAVYACKYKLSNNSENIKYGKCSFEYDSRMLGVGCGIMPNMVEGISISESCISEINKWEKCHTSDGKNIWIYIYDDKTH